MNKSKLYLDRITLFSIAILIPFVITDNAFAITIKKAELSGTTLGIEGDQATSNAAILVDGQIAGNADNKGKYKFDLNAFSSSNCIVLVSDGTNTVSNTIKSCTPVTPPPQNILPIANAGGDVSIQDIDFNGVESVILNGAASSDADGSVVSWEWHENGLAIASGVNSVLNFSLGIHTVELLVTDNLGATATDTVIISVLVPPPPQNISPIADAGIDISIQDIDANNIESVTLNGAASSDADGTIVSWEWRENGLPIASGVNSVLNFSLGIHTVELLVTDNQGAAAVDTVIISVVPALPTPIPPLASLVPDAILESNQTYSGSFDPALMGSSVASAGDVNGDGFDDVIIGARGWDTPGVFFDEGAVFVFHGSANGITGFDPETANTFIQSHEGGSEFGTSVAGAGDVNGDGFDDIIVGAPLANPSGLGVSGAAYIFLGGPLGVQATSPADAVSVLESKQIEGHMGRSVSGAGDVNGDGFDDIIVAAGLYGQPFNPPILNQGSGRQGAAFVFLGSSTGIVGNQPANAHAQLVPWVEGEPSQPNLGFGMQVADAGDVNGDGYADVMVGWPSWNLARTWPGLDTGNPPNEGAVFIYHGGPSGITGSNTSNANTRMEGNQLEAFFGNAIATAGDVNADGFSDIIIGAIGYPIGDPLLNSQEGAAFVFLGSPSGIFATSPADAQTSLQGSELAEWVGRSVSGIGDFDGDGFDDVIVSARIYPGSLVNEGISYIFRGSTSGVVASGLTDAYTRITSNRENGDLGFGIAGAGDVDFDGLSDIIAGVTGYTGGEDREGAAFVYLGSPSFNPPNQPPVIKTNLALTLRDNDNNGVELAILDAIASFDVDGTIVSYDWQEGTTILGSTATILSSLSIGDHSITLTVTDDGGASVSETVLVHVISGITN